MHDHYKYYVKCDRTLPSTSLRPFLNELPLCSIIIATLFIIYVREEENWDLNLSLNFLSLNCLFIILFIILFIYLLFYRTLVLARFSLTLLFILIFIELIYILLFEFRFLHHSCYFFNNLARNMFQLFALDDNGRN